MCPRDAETPPPAYHQRAKGTFPPWLPLPGCFPPREGRVQVERQAPVGARAGQGPGIFVLGLIRAGRRAIHAEPQPLGAAEPLEAGLEARIWPPDCFPDAHPPDRLTVQGRGDVEERSDYLACIAPERSDPLTVRPEGVGGDRP